jgi:general secretion pathway protein I
LAHVRPRRAGAAGFTLIEILVALAIAAFALIGLLGLHNRSLGAVARDQDFTRATLLARELMAGMEVREQWPDLGFVSGEGYDENVRWEREVSETPIPDVRKVDLRVIFDERNPNAVRLVYYLRDRREKEEEQQLGRGRRR